MSTSQSGKKRKKRITKIKLTWNSDKNSNQCSWKKHSKFNYNRNDFVQMISHLKLPMLPLALIGIRCSMTDKTRSENCL